MIKNHGNWSRSVFKKSVDQIKKIQKNEIENSKKTRVHFKIIGLNRIKKLEVN
jgi:hypothetical protein